MTTTDTQTPQTPQTTQHTQNTPRPTRVGRPADFATLFPELYRSAFTAAHTELGNRAGAQEVTLATLARAHARWSGTTGFAASAVAWVSMAARTQALGLLKRQQPGREVLLDDETELRPGEIPGPGPDDLATVMRRGAWLRRRRRAGWVVAGACLVAAALLAIWLGHSMPPAPREPTTVPGTVRTQMTATSSSTLLFGRISAGRSEQGSVRVTFEPMSREEPTRVTGPATQLVIEPGATLLVDGRKTPEELVQTLNRSLPGGEAYVRVTLTPNGRITALRQE
ncbi:hypothetical protein [Kineosporia sp. NBRC 101731]|uniref:hypothetical protein n=1 Tax=Kineosporia sp. NBRC 101731 TaxID=3032199 RepID=UPI0024A141D6|nr:hypothetical protein [Kineosporia sp. NBRC 101731]GLY27114.1 hypothetical protein Kisp02_04790 [Kineosporia sp. NBRC 101731]